MTVRQRISAIRLAEKLDRSPDYARQLGVSVVFKKAPIAAEKKK